jgi:hypothetical protein
MQYEGYPGKESGTACSEDLAGPTFRVTHPFLPQWGATSTGSWKGIGSGESMSLPIASESVIGIWFDRMQEYAVRRRGEDFERLR